jgi:hypothetical protein
MIKIALPVDKGLDSPSIMDRMGFEAFLSEVLNSILKISCADRSVAEKPPAGTYFFV